MEHLCRWPPPAAASLLTLAFGEAIGTGHVCSIVLSAGQTHVESVPLISKLCKLSNRKFRSMKQTANSSLFNRVLLAGSDAFCGTAFQHVFFLFSMPAWLCNSLCAWKMTFCFCGMKGKRLEYSASLLSWIG